MPNLSPAALKPRSPGNAWAYWKVTDMATAALLETWKRRRKPIDFIPTEDAMAACACTYFCPVCGSEVTAADAAKGGRGIRGEYRPRTQSITLWHYQCAWQRTFEAIVEMGRRIA